MTPTAPRALRGIRRVVALTLSATLLLSALSAGLWAAGDALPDPLPIRRVLLSPDRLRRELDQVAKGVLLQLPREEFEAKVQAAAKAVARRRGLPRLLQASYRAAYGEQALTGTLEWRLDNPSAAAAAWPVQPINLALRRPRFENREAVLADLDGKGPSLHLDAAGQHAVFADWSARGEQRPDGTYFALELPECPVAQLEIDLPPGQVVTALNQSIFVTGPHPAEPNDSRKRWRIVCSSRSQLNLLIRQTEGAQPSVLVARSQQTTQELTPTALDATYEIDLSVLHQPVRQLVCECDPTLRPYAAAFRGRDVAWELRAPASAGQPAQLVIDVREPVWEGTLVVRCLAPLRPTATNGTAAAGSWSSPVLRLARAVPRGESLSLRFHPDLQADNIQFGGFRLVASAVEPDQTQRLQLIGGGVEPDGAPAGTPTRRPSAVLRSAAPTFRARQIAHWQLGAARQTLTLHTSYDVLQGRVFQLPVRLPPHWEVERVETVPANLVRGWSVQRGGTTAPAPRNAADSGESTLLVELQSPLLPAGDAVAAAARPRAPTLTVRLVPAPQSPTLDRDLPFPIAEPLDARFREGALAIDFDEQELRPLVRASLPEAEPEEESTLGARPPDLYFPYRGTAVQGTLRLQRRPPVLRARARTDVYLAGGQAVAEVQVQIEAESGTLDAALLDVTTTGGSPWEWKVEQGGVAIARAELARVAGDASSKMAIGLASSLRPVAALAARPGGDTWRLSFARPLRPRESIRLRTTRKVERQGERWSIPLVRVGAADRMEGTAALHLAGADRLQVDAHGLREAAAPSSTGARPTNAWREFSYGDDPASLQLRGAALASPRDPGALIDRVSLITVVGPGALLRHHLTFDVSSWSQGALPVVLPLGARFERATVDGRWLTHPLQRWTDDNRLELALPVPDAEDESRQAPRRFEVVYATDAPQSLQRRLVAPLPDLPAAPLIVRRIWRLPSGLRPVFDGTCRRLPGPGDDGFAANLVRWPAEVFRRSVRWFGGQRATDPAFDQRLAMEESLAALVTARKGQSVPLAEIADFVAHAGPRAEPLLVVDTAALFELGLTPDLPLVVDPPVADGLAAFPGEDRGLRLIAGPAAFILTSRAQGEQWTHRPTGVATVPPAVARALAEAIQTGRDESGRFRLPAEWVRSGSLDVPSSGHALNDALQTPAEWTDWSPVAGAPQQDRIDLVAVNAVAAIGWLLVGLLILLLARLRGRAPHRARLMLLLWLAGAGVALLWLPAALAPIASWPFLAAAAIGLALYLRSMTRRVPVKRGRSTVPGAVAIGALIVVVGVGWSFQAPAARNPYTVYLIAGADDSAERQAVLAPPELLERLTSLGEGASSSPGAVLLAAAYDAKVQGADVVCNATFDVHSFSAAPTPLTLPLGGEGLRVVGAVLLDGAPAALATLPRPRLGYQLQMPGSGRHRVEMSFAAPILGPPADRRIQFAAPAVLQSELRMTVPATTAYLEAPARRGGQRTVREASGVRLEASLGRLTTPIVVRWHEQAAAAQPPAVQYREAYLWNLGVGASSLQGVVEFTIAQGATPTLHLDLPAELEVRNVEVRRGDGPAPATLRDWRVVPGAARALQLDFVAPISGVVLVALDLMPGGPLPATVALPLPTPRGQAVAKGSYLAYRASGLQVQRQGLLRITGIRPDEFAPFWPAATRPEPSVIDYACTIGREPGGAPMLRLRLLPAPPALQAIEELHLRVGTRTADFHDVVRLRAPDADLAFTEFEINSASTVLVTQVKGAGVRRWRQQGNRLLVLLDRAVAAATLDIDGWLALSPADKPDRLELPRFRVLGAQEQTTTVRLAAANGLALVPQSLRNLVPLPDNRASASDLAFVSRQSDFGGSLRVIPVAANASARVLTFAEVRDRQLVVSALVELRVARGELQSLRLRLKNWPGDDLRLEAPGLAQRRERRRASGEREWMLELQPPAKGSQRIGLTATLPLDAAGGGIPMPDLSIDGLDGVERWLAVSGLDLETLPAAGLTPIADPPRVLTGWAAGEAERLRRTSGTLWQITRPEWRMRVRARPAVVETAKPEVILAEHSAALADGKHWLHEGHFTIRHDAGAELIAVFPADVTVLSVTVGGTDAPPLPLDRRRLWLPLSGQSGVHRVRLLWRYLDPGETIDRPDLRRVSLLGVEDSLELCAVTAPPGWTLSANERDGPRFNAGPAETVLLELHRAAAELRCAETLAAERDAGPLAAAQRLFYAHCRRAAQELDRVAEADDRTVGPDGTPPREWLRQLRERNQANARRLGFEDVRAEAERLAFVRLAVPRPTGLESDPLPPAIALGPVRAPNSARVADVPGTVFHAVLRPEQRSPRLQLGLAEPVQEEARLHASAQWLGFLLAVGVLSFIPAVRQLLRTAWPEQLAVVALIGWRLAGPTPLAVGLLGLAIFARGLLLLRWMLKRLRTRREPSTTAPLPASGA